jgi:hypothetical protein
MYRFFFWAFLVQLNMSSAFAGKTGSGGGDRCEDRFKAVAGDIAKWIHDGGPAGLALGHLSVRDYSDSMAHWIAGAKIQCVGPGEHGYPVLVGKTPKECRSFRQKDGTGRVICDRKKFYSGLKDPENDAIQYRIVHHEFATLAGFEIPNGDDSDYHLSDQITAFLEEQLVKRLAIRPATVTSSQYLCTQQGGEKPNRWPRHTLEIRSRDDKASLTLDGATDFFPAVLDGERLGQPIPGFDAFETEGDTGLVSEWGEALFLESKFTNAGSVPVGRGRMVLREGTEDGVVESHYDCDFIGQR